MTGLLASWGELEAVERVARLRALAALVYVFAGPAYGDGVGVALRAAEDDAGGLAAADAALGTLPAIPRRKVMSVLTRVC